MAANNLMAYDLENKKHGMIIFNHNIDDMKPLNRSQDDADLIKKTLEKFGFSGNIYSNLTRNEIMTTLKTFSHHILESSDQYGCVVIVVNTHGKDLANLMSKDEPYDPLTILNDFKHMTKAKLFEKPVILIIQAYVETGEPMTDNCPKTLTPTAAHGLMLYNLCSDRSGPLFIKFFCQHIEKLWDKDDLISIFLKVKAEVTKKCSAEINTIADQTTLKGKIYFKKVRDDQIKMAPHASSATSDQMETLLNFMDEHRSLARGKLRKIEDQLQAKRLWEELCNALNCMGGCTKTIQQWKKVWLDKKHLAKKAAAESRRSAEATGGGPSTAPKLTLNELKVLEIIGFGERQTKAGVPALGETDEPMPSTSSEEIKFALNLELEPSQLSEPASQPVSQESVTSRRFSQSTRPQRRQSAAGTDVRSRLFQFEEQRAETVRNTELAGIRVALSELTGLFREYLDRN